MMRIEIRLFSTRLLPAIAASTIALLAVTTSSAATLRTIALTGQHAVGAPDGVVYSSIGGLTLNNSGQIAFGGSVAGPGVDSTNDTAAWSEGQGSLALIVRSGDQVPGTMGAVFHGVGLHRINDAGQTLIAASINELSLPTGNGYWLHGSSGLESIVRLPDQAAGLPAGVTYKNLGVTAFNNSGQVLFSGSVQGPGVDSSNAGALWSASPGNVQLIARHGDQAPDAPTGIVFTHFDQPEEKALNNAGRAAFYGGLGGPDITTANNRGIFFGAAGNVNMVAREGSQIAGLPAGFDFGTLLAPSTNSAGQLAFAAGFSSPGSDGSGIFVGAPGSFAFVARSGDPAPGAPAGVNYSSFWTPVLNEQGRVVFNGFLTGSGVNSSNNFAIFSQGSGVVEMIARRGDQTPDTLPGTLFSFLGAPAINGRGQIAFQSDLSGPGTTLFDRNGLWATDAAGELHLIVRTNDQLEVAPGDFRTVSNLFFDENNGDSDGRKSAFNDLGQIAFEVFFTDGSSGLFVSNLVAVPEPGTILMSGFLVAAAFLPRGRRQSSPRR